MKGEACRGEDAAPPSQPQPPSAGHQGKGGDDLVRCPICGRVGVEKKQKWFCPACGQLLRTCCD